MGAYSKLDAVNEMLLYAGESTVSSLTTEAGVDTVIAQQILDQKTVDAQARGLANNLTIRTLTSDAQGVIYLPANTSSAKLLDNIESNRDDVHYARITTRGWSAGAPYFYNLTDDTKFFTASTDYDAELIVQIDWEDMDTPVQKEITMQAARQYQMLSQGDGSVDNYLAQLELYYGAKARGADVNSKGYNTLFQQNNAFKATNRVIRNDPQRFRFWRAPGGE